MYREQGVRMWRAVLLASGSREVADDAVAEAFAQALRRGEALRDPAAWVWRVVVPCRDGRVEGARTSGAFEDERWQGCPTRSWTCGGRSPGSR